MPRRSRQAPNRRMICRFQMSLAVLKTASCALRSPGIQPAKGRTRSGRSAGGRSARHGGPRPPRRPHGGARPANRSRASHTTISSANRLGRKCDGGRGRTPLRSVLLANPELRKLSTTTQRTTYVLGTHPRTNPAPRRAESHLRAGSRVPRVSPAGTLAAEASMARSSAASILELKRPAAVSEQQSRAEVMRDKTSRRQT